VTDLIALSPQSWGVLLLFGILPALAHCFFGYRLLKLWLFLAGLALGLASGYGAGMRMNLGQTPCILIGVVLGLALGFLAFKIWKLGVFLLCGGMAYLFGAVWIPQWWLTALVAIAVGILAVKFVRPVVILSTGLSGGSSAVQALSCALVSLGALPTVNFLSGWLAWVLGIVLAVGGIAYQFKHSPRS
jgi:hypothetical protein